MGRPRKQTCESTSRFVAYYRVSTQRQGESGLGLDAQRAAVARYIQGKGDLLHAYTEIESGKKDDRPELAAALALCKKTGAVLVIAKLDRLARRVSFISKLMEDACDFVACDMPAANKFVLHILAAVAEAEREAISSRTKAGLAVIKDEIARQGHRISKRSGRKFTKLGNPRWKESIAKARAKRQFMCAPDRMVGLMVTWRSEGRSIQKIVDDLNTLGLKTPSGHQWHPSSVWNALKKEAA